MCSTYSMCARGRCLAMVSKLNRSEQDESYTDPEMEGQSTKMRAIIKNRLVDG